MLAELAQEDAVLENWVKPGSEDLNKHIFATTDPGAEQSWFKVRLTGPGAIYNAGNVLALVAGIVLSRYDVWGQESFAKALYAHLMGSPEAVWLTTAMILFIVSGEIYHRAYQASAQPKLLAWADFVSGVAAIALTVALVMLGDKTAALLAGCMLSFGKLGSAFLPIFARNGGARFDRILRLTVIASRAPSILSLGMAVAPAIWGSIPMQTALLPLIMIICFLLWLWADLLLLR